MKVLRKVGVTSEIWQIFIADSSSTTGAGLAGLVFNSAGLTAYYHRDTNTTATAITLATMTVGTFTSSGFKEIDATNMPGWYQFCPPDAALATGAKSCAFHLKGATNMAPLPIEVDLDGQVDVTHWNGTAVSTPATAGIPEINVKNINNVAAATPGAAGGLVICGSNAATTFATFTVSGAVAFQSTFTVTTSTSLAALSATTVTFSGAVAFQSTFVVTGGVTFTAGLTSNITGNLIGTVSTLTTYTGNTPQTGDSFARIGATGSGLTSLASAANLVTVNANVLAIPTNPLLASSAPTNFSSMVISAGGVIGSNVVSIVGIAVGGSGTTAHPWGPA